jgi:hypothetical protein
MTTNEKFATLMNSKRPEKTEALLTLIDALFESEFGNPEGDAPTLDLAEALTRT